MNKVIASIYSGTFILFIFFTYLFIDPNFIYLKNLFTGFAFSNREIVTAVYILFILVFFICYSILLKHLHTINLSILKKFIFISLTGIVAYPAALSFDLFNYIATAKVLYHYFENPYIIMPIEFIGDPVLLFTHAANKIALYGPVWILLTAIPYYLSFGNYLISIIILKLLLSLFFLGTIWVIWKITRSSYAVLFFATNPLVLIETFISGHNDIVMMFLAICAFYFLKSKKNTFALILLLASILIKYATIFLIPVFIYYFFISYKRKKVEWDKIYLYSFILMLIIFFLSPIREEIYPWYAIWPITFFSLIAEKRKTYSYIFLIFSLCLMMRYVPFMLLGTYFGPTPLIKIALTFIVPGFFVLYFILVRFLKTK